MKRFAGILAAGLLLLASQAFAAGPFTEKDFDWDPFLEHYKGIIIAGVNMIAREKPEECAVIDPKSIAKYGGTPDDPEFVITCGPADHPTHAYFSKTDVTGDPASDVPRE
jgi:hypothetical protein